jgi:tetratricopeptide (TPR) repeat protein
MSWSWILLLVFAAASTAQQDQDKQGSGKQLSDRQLSDRKDSKAPVAPAGKEEAPPEEDESLVPKEYAFNPLQASKEMKIGDYYFKRGKFRAASMRFQEATKWDNNNAEAFLRLGESKEKLHDKKAAAEAYKKYLEIAPDAKDSEDVKKRLTKLPK